MWIALRVVTTGVGLGLIQQVLIRKPDVETGMTIIALVLGVSGVVWGLIPIFAQPDAPEWRAVVALWLFGNQSVITAVCSPSSRAFW